MKPARFQPRLGQLPEAAGHVGDRLLVVHPARKPGARRIGKDRPADGKALDRGRGERRLEAFDQFLGRRFQPKQHDTAAPWIIFGDHRIDLLPGRARSLRLQLPPVRLDAERVELFHRRRDRIVGRAARSCRR